MHDTAPEGYDYNVWPKHEEESTDKEEFIDKKESFDKEESVDLFDVPPPEGDEEVKKGKELKI